MELNIVTKYYQYNFVPDLPYTKKVHGPMYD